MQAPLSSRPVAAVNALPRLAIVPDFPEEGWPSMDLVSKMLLQELRAHHTHQVKAANVCPSFRRRFQGSTWLRQTPWAANADRLLNRFWDYPRHLGRMATAYDFYHICDHSYAQLVHVLPAGRTGVFCHDLDTFRCLLHPAQDPRPQWFKQLVRRTLRGLQKAALVFHTTTAVRTQIEQHALLDPERLVQAPYGLAPVFHPGPGAEDDAPDGMPPLSTLLPSEGGRVGRGGRAPFLLHVGSAIPRKRIDVLLNVFAEVRRHFPEIACVQVGGQWTVAQREQIQRRGLAAVVTQIPRLDQKAIAALYQRAALVLLPSEAEGFGLPVIEALACGAIVVASDLPVLREVGGTACVYCPVADVAAWADTVSRLLADPLAAPARPARLAWASRFSWQAQARIILDSYLRLL